MSSRGGYSKKDVEKAVEEVLAGKSLGSVALAYNIPKSTVYDHAKKMGKPITPVRSTRSVTTSPKKPTRNSLGKIYKLKEIFIHGLLILILLVQIFKAFLMELSVVLFTSLQN